MIEAVIAGISAGVTFTVLIRLLDYLEKRKKAQEFKMSYLEKAKPSNRNPTIELQNTVRVVDDKSLYCTFLCPKNPHYHHVGDVT